MVKAIDRGKPTVRGSSPYVLIWQTIPAKPPAHEQKYPPAGSGEQDPPFWHGFWPSQEVNEAGAGEGGTGAGVGATTVIEAQVRGAEGAAGAGTGAFVNGRVGDNVVAAGVRGDAVGVTVKGAGAGGGGVVGAGTST